MNSRHQSTVFLLRDCPLPLINPVQFNLIKPKIARRWRWVPTLIRGEIEMRLTGHDNVHPIMLRGYRKPVRRIEVRFRRDQRPGADARV